MKYRLKYVQSRPKVYKIDRDGTVTKSLQRVQSLSSEWTLEQSFRLMVRDGVGMTLFVTVLPESLDTQSFGRSTKTTCGFKLSMTRHFICDCKRKVNTKLFWGFTKTAYIPNSW